MNTSLLIPKKNAIKQARTGGGEDFWDSFWKKFNSARDYAVRIKQFEDSLIPITNLKVDHNKDLYVEIKLDRRASSKSTRPTGIWEQTNLDVVEAKDNSSLTLSGKKEDFTSLVKILHSAEYEAAKTGKGVNRTEKNLYRQLYAVSELNDKNTLIDGRIDSNIRSLIENDYRGEIDCLIELYSNKRFSEYDEVYDLFTKKLSEIKITKRNEKFFIHNISYRGALNIQQIKSILGDVNFNFVWLIKTYPTFIAQRLIPNDDISTATVNPPHTDEIVGIIDSGIQHVLMDSTLFNKEKFIEKNRVEDHNHGTFVASRILFGDNIFTQVTSGNRELTPCAKYLDIQVLHKNGNVTQIEDIDTLQNAIEEVVRRYPDVKIYNLSIAEETAIEDGIISGLTEFIDDISRKNDVLFICSAGNQQFYRIESNYNEVFSKLSYMTQIASPSDALNVLTVGSIAGKVDDQSLCQMTNFPSPFTRKGGMRDDWKKPELVANGGNKMKSLNGDYNDDSYILASNNRVGVEGIDVNGLTKDVGTSFSTPLITRQCVYLMDYIKKSNLSSLMNLKGNYSNLIKALLIHSTSRVDQANILEESVKRAYGFGIADYKKIIRGDENNISIVYCDTIQYQERKHKITFELPKYLIGEPAEFILTLVYNPPVNRNFPKEYNMIRLSGALRTLTPSIDMETGENLVKEGYISPKKWNWENYKKSNFNVQHYRVTKNKLRTPYFEILVQMLVSDKYEQLHKGREQDISQSYSLILTVVDKSFKNRLRSQVLESNQFETLVENNIEIHNLV